MWPFSEMSLGAAIFAGSIANWVLVASLVGGVISTFVIVKTNDVKKQHWAEDRRQSNERIVALLAETAEAKAREKEANVKLEELRRYAAPRLMDPRRFMKEIAGVPKVPVQIWFLEEASDAFSFAFMIWDCLSEAGWSAARPIPIPDLDKSDPRFRHMTRTGAAGGGPNGVTVVIPSDDYRRPSGEALMNAVGKSNEYGGWISINPAIPIPSGMFRIVVSAKPDPRLLYTPTTTPNPNK